MEVSSSNSILPVTNPAQGELSLIRNNMRITFCHAETSGKATWTDVQYAGVEQEEGFFPHLDAALGLTFTRHYFTASSFQNSCMLKRKKGKGLTEWRKCWREWLQCGNLSISGAQESPCLDKTQGKQHNLCLAGLHPDSYSWCSVRIEGLLNFALQLKLQQISSTIPVRKSEQVLKIRQGTGSSFPNITTKPRIAQCYNIQHVTIRKKGFLRKRS